MSSSNEPHSLPLAALLYHDQATVRKSLDRASTSFARQEQDIEMATALMSISGPYRVVGDIYLSCVGMAGLGMCRSLRAQFEQCAKESASDDDGIDIERDASKP